MSNEKEIKKRKRSRGNGEGSVYYSESKKKWVAQYTTGKGEDGKQRRKTFYADTRKAVKAKLEAYIKGEIPTNSRKDLTICGIMSDTYDYKFNANIIGSATYGRAKETTKIIEGHYIGKMPVQTVTENDIKSFFQTLTGYSNSVIKKVFGQLNFAFNYAVNNDIMRKNPLNDKLHLPMPKSDKPTKKVRALTVDEEKHLLSVLAEHPNINCKTQMLISLFSGMRMGEVNALTAADVDMNGRTVTVSKTLTRDENYKVVVGQSTKTYAGLRTIQMNDVLYNVFKEFFADEYAPNDLGALFVTRRGGNYVSTNAVNTQLQRTCAKYEIAEKVNAHMLRHTFATRCIEAGVSAKALQKILGHADITVTLNTYCDVFDRFEAENNSRLAEYFKQSGLDFGS